MGIKDKRLLYTCHILYTFIKWFSKSTNINQGKAQCIMDTNI